MTAPRRTITKRDLVQRIAERTGQTKVLVREVLQHFLDEVAHELENGNRLEFRNFGIFEVKDRSARKALNPKTKTPVVVPPRRVVRFKAGNSLKARVEDGHVANASADGAPAAEVRTSAPLGEAAGGEAMA